MALTQDRNTPEKDGVLRVFPVAAATTIYAGALVALGLGFAMPGATALGLVSVGRAQEAADNANGQDGDALIVVKRGVFRFGNSAAADLITLAEVGSACYIVDDETVAKTNGAGTRSAAGTVEDVDAAGVWVRI